MGDNLNGKVTPEIANPGPLIEAASTKSEALPVESSLTSCVAAVFSGTSPNVRLVVLRANVAVPPPPVRLAPLADSTAGLHVSKSADMATQKASTR